MEKVGGGSELDSIADPFKTIVRHKLVDTNWAPTENIFRSFAKILHLFHAKVLCYQ